MQALILRGKHNGEVVEISQCSWRYAKDPVTDEKMQEWANSMIK